MEVGKDALLMIVLQLWMELILHHLLESFTSRKYVYEKLVGNPGMSCNISREIRVVTDVLYFREFFAQFLIL